VIGFVGHSRRPRVLAGSGARCFPLLRRHCQGGVKAATLRAGSASRSGGDWGFPSPSGLPLPPWSRPMRGSMSADVTIAPTMTSGRCAGDETKSARGFTDRCNWVGSVAIPGRRRYSASDLSQLEIRVGRLRRPANSVTYSNASTLQLSCDNALVRPALDALVLKAAALVVTARWLPIL
jgi:hypothetical protein